MRPTLNAPIPNAECAEEDKAGVGHGWDLVEIERLLSEHSNELPGGPSAPWPGTQETRARKNRATPVGMTRC